MAALTTVMNSLQPTVLLVRGIDVLIKAGILSHECERWGNIRMAIIIAYAMDARRVREADFGPYLEAADKLRALMDSFPGVFVLWVGLVLCGCYSVICLECCVSTKAGRVVPKALEH